MLLIVFYPPKTHFHILDEYFYRPRFIFFWLNLHATIAKFRLHSPDMLIFAIQMSLPFPFSWIRTIGFQQLFTWKPDQFSFSTLYKECTLRLLPCFTGGWLTKHSLTQTMNSSPGSSHPNGICITMNTLLSLEQIEQWSRRQSNMMNIVVGFFLLFFYYLRSKNVKYWFKTRSGCWEGRCLVFSGDLQ